MRRRQGLRQKPWNKPTRAEKWWAVPSITYNGLSNILTLGNNDPTMVLALDGATLRGEFSTPATPMSMQRVKLHRFQGYIWCYLDPQDQVERYVAATTQLPQSAGAKSTVLANTEEPESNISMLNYAWLKVKELGLTPGTQQLPAGTAGLATERAYSVKNSNLGNMLLRDDLITWGTIPVFGTCPRMFSEQAATTNGAMVLGNPGQYLQSHVAKIPFPRVPKSGFNLGHGEALICVAAQWPGPGDLQDTLDDTVGRRNLVIAPQLRCLCSA